MDTRYQKLAHILVTYSTQVKQGQHVWIRTIGVPALNAARAVYKEVLAQDAHPYMDIADTAVASHFYKVAKEAHLEKQPLIDEFIANWADCVITLVGEENTRSLTNSDSYKLLLRQKAVRTIRSMIMKKPWVLTYIPTPALAQEAGMGTDEFEDFYFSAVLRDWNEESKRIKNLASQLNNAKDIHVVGEETDLHLSAFGRIFIPDCGECNMPGGEVFTAPLDTSATGHVYFNYPLLRSGKMIRDIRLTFQKGKVVKASASENQDFLHKILATDAGASYLGEFAIGMNPGIQSYMNNVLFDEKIEGTLHMALGEAYEECNGTNKSYVHMDIVKDMKPKGSVITADGKVILEEGKLFV